MAKRKTKLVCGVGVNDADYDVTRGQYTDGKWIITWICPMYQRWKSMLKRCYSAKYLRDNTTYIGCSVSDQWLYFRKFREWMVDQNWEGLELDKDLLSLGNKIYSSTNCVFVSKTVNNFITESHRLRGDWPIGVSYNKSKGLFQSECRNPFTGVAEYLGSFSCPQKAHEAWRRRKHQLACDLADIETDIRVANALRLRYA